MRLLFPIILLLLLLARAALSDHSIDSAHQLCCILTAASGYTPDRLFPFVASYIKHSATCRLVIFTDELEPYRSLFTDYLASHHQSSSAVNGVDFSANGIVVEDFNYDGVLTKEGISSQRPILTRYFVFRQYLRAHGECKGVLITDSRDVVFQSNPFDFELAGADASLKPVVFAAEEPVPALGNEHWNSMWIRECYGGDVLESIRNATISCSGTTLGPLAGMLVYMNDMCSEIARTEFKCNDQGNHNYIVQTKYLPRLGIDSPEFHFLLAPNALSPLYTVGIAHPSALPFHWNGSRIVRNGSRPLPPVIHQMQIFAPWNDVLLSLGLCEHSASANGRSFAVYSWAGPPYACIVGCHPNPHLHSSIGRTAITLPSSYPGVKVRATYVGFQACIPALVHGRSMWDGYCEDLDPRVWFHCKAEVSEALQQLGCVNHTMTHISPLLMMPHNASVIEAANAYISFDMGSFGGTVFTEHVYLKHVVGVRAPALVPPYPLIIHHDVIINGVCVAYPLALGHFLHEALPRVITMARLYPHAPILLALDDKVREVLTLLPWMDSSRMIQWDPLDRSIVHHARTVVHYVEEPYLLSTSPNRMGVSTFYPAEVMMQAHRELVATLAPPPSAPEIVVVKRKGRRQLAQHEELLVALAEAFPQYHVRVFLAEGHVREHAQMFYNAAAVIAPHGAGLRNIMFSRPGTAVLEIGYSCSKIGMPSTLHQGCTYETSYYPLATALGHRYGLILGAGIPSEEYSMWVGNCFAEIEVAVEEVIMLLQQLLLS